MARKPKTDLNFQGEITIPLEGVEYVLRPSYAAVSTCERLLGKTLWELADSAVNGKLQIDEMAVIVAEMMHAFGRENPDDPLVSTYRAVKTERLAELIYDAGSPRVAARIAVLLVGALSGGYDAGGKPKATGEMMTTLTRPTPVAA